MRGGREKPWGITGSASSSGAREFDHVRCGESLLSACQEAGERQDEHAGVRAEGGLLVARIGLRSLAGIVELQAVEAGRQGGRVESGWAGGSPG